MGQAARIISHRIDEAVRLAVTAYAEQQAGMCKMCKEREDEHLACTLHDLRSPLNAVCLVVEELKEGLDQKALAESGDLFEILRNNLQCVTDLTTSLLATSAQRSAVNNTFRPERRTLELRPLIQRLLVDLRPVSSKHAIEVHNEIPPDLTVFADARLLSRVFLNLLSNAFRYAARGRVFVSAGADAKTVTCVVRDNGAGIQPGMLAKVFDKRVTDPAKPGAGLGLTIVKQIVEEHGGTVSAESTPGAGAKFTFTIPKPPES